MSVFILLVCLTAFVSCGNKKQPSKVVSTQEVTCPSGYLEGRSCSNLYATYLGIKPGSVIGSSVTLEPYSILNDMWAKKVKMSPSPVVKNTSDSLLSEYADKRTISSFGDYTDHVDGIVKSLKSSIDWNVVKKDMHLTQQEVNLAKQIMNSFKGEDMVAYVLTELMPSADGKFNREVLNIMLKTGGIEYVANIPAMGDKKTSFGPYQFTEYALFHTQKEMRGASIINCAVSDDANKIPGSVAKLRGDDHHRAAYLFATYNICLLVKGLNKKQFAMLQKVWKSNKDDLFIYCATAHHLPGVARTSAKRWIHNQAKKPFEDSCGRRILQYAKKTRANLSVV